MSRKTGMTLTVFMLQNPVICDILRNLEANQRDTDTVSKTHLVWLFCLYKLKPNMYIRSEYCAVIIAEYSFLVRAEDKHSCP